MSWLCHLLGAKPVGLYPASSRELPQGFEQRQVDGEDDGSVDDGVLSPSFSHTSSLLPHCKLTPPAPPGFSGCLHSPISASLSRKANGYSGLGRFSQGSGQEACGCGLVGGSWGGLR